MFARLERVRADTVAFLEATRERELDDPYLRHPFFRHPFLGAFRVRDMMAWGAWHEERHRRQLVRVRAALGLA